MKTLKLMMFLFSAVGLCVLGLGVKLILNTQDFEARAAHATGTVVRLDVHTTRHDKHTSTTYNPVVEFQVPDGRSITFTSSAGSNPPAFRVGEPVEVLYLPGDEHKAEIKSFTSLWLGPIIAFALGGILSAVGFGMFAANAAKAKTNAWLKQFGQRVQTEGVQVGLNTSLKVNGRHPYRISSQWKNPVSGMVHVFNSDNIWYDPQPYVQGRSIEVLVDPQNPKRYWMDISFLPAQAA